MKVIIENKKWKEHLHGGKSDGTVPSDYDQKNLKIGSKVETEHTSNLDTEKEISMDHFQENPTYYDELIMSGIADEEDAIDTYNKLKTDDDKKKAINKIQKHLNKEKDKLKENYILKFQNFIKNEKLEINFDNGGNDDWSIFKISHGEKMFLTELNPNDTPFRWEKIKYSNGNVLKFYLDRAKELIEKSKPFFDEEIGIVNSKGLQLIKGKYDGLWRRE